MNANIILRLGGIMLILIVLDSCLQPDPLNQPFSTFQPVDLEDGLILSDPAVEKVEPESLRQIYYDMHDENLYWQFRSMLVFRNGKLIAESYMKDDADRTERHLIWSCTKQFMGVLTGMAISEGLIEAINDPVSKYMPERLSGHPDKAGITIRNLLMMQSGINYSNDGTSGQTDKIMTGIPSWSQLLSRPWQDYLRMNGQIRYYSQKLD
jgi:CubicO group peptidase (beta-lactamase class C family)